MLVEMLKVGATKQVSADIIELLESDDDLPDSYDEVPDMPQYQNDLRFEINEPIQFKWLQKNLEKCSAQAGHLKEQRSIQEEQYPSKELFHELNPSYIEPFPDEKLFHKPLIGLNNKNKILVSKGILTKQDIFLIKCIKEFSNDTTLLWFIDFLKLKTEQPHQRSCLVGDMTSDHYNGLKEPMAKFSMRYYFKLVVK